MNRFDARTELASIRCGGLNESESRKEGMKDRGGKIMEESSKRSLICDENRHRDYMR